jgi:hypothetical protein
LQARISAPNNGQPDRPQGLKIARQVHDLPGFHVGVARHPEENRDVARNTIGQG